MSDEITTKRYTRKEAEAATELFIATGGQMRQILLDLFEREAHTALGYANFDEYTKDRLGAEWKQAYLRQLRQWARVERNAAGSNPPKSLPWVQVLQLARLPEDHQHDAYTECAKLCEHGKAYRPQSFLTNLTHIVNRRLKAIAPPAPETPAAEATQPVEEKTVTVAEDGAWEYEQAEGTPSVSTDEPAQEELALVGEDGTPLVEVEYTEPASTWTHEEMEMAVAMTPPWSEWEEVLNTALTCVQNQNIDLTPKDRRFVQAFLCDLAAWFGGHHADTKTLSE